MMKDDFLGENNYNDIGKFAFDLYKRAMTTHEEMPNVSDSEAFNSIGSTFMATMQVIIRKIKKDREDIKKEQKKMFLNDSDYMILGKGRVAFLDACVKSIKMFRKDKNIVNHDDYIYDVVGKMFIESSINKVNELMGEK